VPDKSSESRLLPRRLDLAAIRQSKGVTLDHIIETTKISKRFLQAIEEYDFDKLPGGVFNTSYIRQYARAVDIDECELLESYYAMTGVSRTVDGPELRAERKPPGRGWRLPVASAKS
jgi:cytoskeletal protein RodZ